MSFKVSRPISKSVFTLSYRQIMDTRSKSKRSVPAPHPNAAKVKVKRRRISKTSPSPSKTNILDLSFDVFHDHIIPMLDCKSLLELRQTNSWFRGMIDPLEDTDQSWGLWKIPSNLRATWKGFNNYIPLRWFIRTVSENRQHVIGCQSCGKKRIRKYYWDFSLRVCTWCLSSLSERDYNVTNITGLPKNVFQDLPKMLCAGWSEYRRNTVDYYVYLNYHVLTLLRNKYGFSRNQLTTLYDFKPLMIKRRRENMIAHCQSIPDPISEADLSFLHRFEDFYNSHDDIIDYSYWISEFRAEMVKNERDRIEKDRKASRKLLMIQLAQTINPNLTEMELEQLRTFQHFNELPSSVIVPDHLEWTRYFCNEYLKKTGRNRVIKEFSDLDYPLSLYHLKSFQQFDKLNVRSVDIIDIDCWIKRIRTEYDSLKALYALCKSLNPTLSFSHFLAIPETNNFMADPVSEDAELSKWAKRICDNRNIPSKIEELICIWRNCKISNQGKFDYRDYEKYTGRPLYDDLDRVGFGRKQGRKWTRLYEEFKI